MVVQILGSGCPNCKKLEQNARAAMETLGLTAEIEKITDVDAIVEMGVLRTPGLAIDGEVKRSGRVFSPQEIAAVLKEATALSGGAGS